MALFNKKDKQKKEKEKPQKKPLEIWYTEMAPRSVTMATL